MSEAVWESEATKQARQAIEAETLRQQRIQTARMRLDQIQKKEERERKERLAVALKNYNEHQAFRSALESALAEIAEIGDIPPSMKRALKQIKGLASGSKAERELALAQLESLKNVVVDIERQRSSR